MNPELVLTPEREGTFGETETGQTTITFRRVLEHTPERVWRAITEADELKAWFPFLSLETHAGGKAVMDFSGGDCPPDEANPEDIDRCVVTEWHPPSLLEYMGDMGGLRFELNAHELGTELILTAVNRPGQGILGSVVCGWHNMLDCLEWSLDGISWEPEGYAGPMKTEIYLYYMKLGNPLIEPV